MIEATAEKFVAALRKLEDSRDLEEITALYADDAEIANVVAPGKFAGTQGARDFWTKYRETFGEMRSEFRNKIYGERSAALEWTTTGTANNNNEIRYSGVTILEIENDKITRSCAYFNATIWGGNSKRARRPNKTKRFQPNSVGTGKPERIRVRNSRSVKIFPEIRPDRKSSAYLNCSPIRS